MQGTSAKALRQTSRNIIENKSHKMDITLFAYIFNFLCIEKIDISVLESCHEEA